MTELLFIIATIVLLGLLLVAAVTPVVPALSDFELKRRKGGGDGPMELDQLRWEVFQDVVSVQKVLQAVFLVSFVLLSVAAFGWLVGSTVAIVVALEYGAIARFGPLRRTSQQLYSRYESSILTKLHSQRSITKWLRSVVPASRETRIDSKEELKKLVNESRQVLSDNEKKLIIASLQFDDTLVSSVMTPKSVVETVKHNEILGPLVLDDLHKTGHSRFPVIEDDVDHVVGILHIKNVLTLDTNKKRTDKVETAMSKQVYYIRDDHNLSQALSAFLSTHHHLFIVINEFRETVGIVTLEDTIETLLGRKIIDEFDAHDDMRAVAARQASTAGSINRTPGSEDV